MSRRYTASLTVASGTCFESWDASDFGSMKTVPVQQLVGSRSEMLLELARAAQIGFERQREHSLLTILEGDSLLIESMRSGGILEAVAQTARME